MVGEFADASPAEDRGEVGGAAAGGGDDGAGKVLAHPVGEAFAGGGVAVVGVQRAAAALSRGDGQSGDEGESGAADAREEDALEASEHE